MHTTKILKKAIGTITVFATFAVPFLTNSINNPFVKAAGISVAITNITIIGQQYSVTFQPNGYTPAVGGIHTNFYFNTEQNNINNKQFFN